MSKVSANLSLKRPDRAPRTPIRIPKTAEVVASRIRKRIIRGELAAGDKLPAEAELIREFGVSRPTIREAIRILESEQLISVSRGARAGALVHGIDESIVARYAGYVLQSRGTTLADIYETRLLIEPAAARIVAGIRSPDHVAALRACTAEQRATIRESTTFLHAVAMFHRTLVECSQRRTMALIFAVLFDIIEKHQIAVSKDRDSRMSPEAAEKFRMPGVRSMEKLTDLIEAGKAAQAEAHWLNHMREAGKVWLTGFRAKRVVDLLD